MIKIVSVLQRKPGMSVEDFQAYWLNKHAPIVSRLPGLRRYVQSHTLLSGYRKAQPAADGIAELWFEDSEALRKLKDSTELAAVLADEPNFVDMTRFIQVHTEEHVIKDGPIPAGGVKNVEFVKKKAGMPLADFQRHWRVIHGPLGASIKTVTRYVQSHTRSSAYGRGADPALDGFALTWFDNTDAMRESARTREYADTRDDEDNFLTVPLDFIITKEHVIVA
ncbi:MAG: EthD family reductase [Proteobacteria bacterium]|nr:EthD family reductase [Pseudomonadota bacterium]